LESNIYQIDDDLIPLIKKLRAEKKKIVFTNGVFDIIHRGHIEYLKEAKSMGDVLIVGLNSDSSVKLIKGDDRPINKQNDRAYILVNLKPVDCVVIFKEDNPFNLIKMIVPEILVKGGDWKPENIIGADIVKKNGGKVISLSYVNNYSTTDIITKIAKN
jgi:rfaE bifunctional protein nucleotidyltransferase chain/domain